MTFFNRIDSMPKFNLNAIHPSWRPCIEQALTLLDPLYLETLYFSTEWLPGAQNIFNAFSLPVSETHYVLFGESPYPRAASANGYAFWDAAVGSLWSETGLSKTVNRATSLRNIIKMLLIAEGLLEPQSTSQQTIAQLDKQALIQTNAQLFNRLLSHGFLLLNATLVLRPNQVRKDAQAWQPFLQAILEFLVDSQPDVQLILFGNIANMIDKLICHLPVKKIYTEHPYNLSFIHNPQVIDFFKPFHLLTVPRRLRTTSNKADIILL